MSQCKCEETTCKHRPEQCNEPASVEDGYCESCIAESFANALRNYRERSGTRSDVGLHCSPDQRLKARLWL
jgi:hypothetical protein